MKEYIGILFLVIVGVVLAIFVKNPKEIKKENKVSGDYSIISTVKYSCDLGKTITTKYYKGPEPLLPSGPGQPPRPTGKVEVSLDGGEFMSLDQTISGSGIRYANTDESFVFWSKREEALIMRNNSMDLSYTNCKALN